MAAAGGGTAPPAWRRAAVETTIKLSTTGGTVWGAAEAAIAFFERHWDGLFPAARESEDRPLRVLELGAGCGKLGLTLALNTTRAGGGRGGDKGGAGGRGRPCSVLLTEQPDGLEHLERNVRLNLESGGGAGKARIEARAAACDWGDFAERRREATDEDDDDEDATSADDLLWRSCERVSPESLPRADVIIGSDLIYLPEGARALPRTIAALLERATRASAAAGRADDNALPVAFYSHTRHRFDALDVAFEEECAACGFELVEMDPETGRPYPGEEEEQGEGGAGGGGRRARSPPPFSELFPEHRVAIYRLRLAG